MNSLQVRQTDETGRIVVPKELRESLGLEGKPLAIHFLEDKKGIAVCAAKSQAAKRSRRKLDDEGRLLISSAIRKQLGWGKTKQLEIIAENDMLLLLEPARRCHICGSPQSLLTIKESHLCKDCLHGGNEIIEELWMALLDELLKKYLSKCAHALKDEDDREAVHHARTTGRKLQNLLEFIGVEKEHFLVEQIRAAHKKLGKVRDHEVLAEAFYNRAEQEEDEGLASVYREMAEKSDGKLKKKLEDKLPSIINEEFKDSWSFFFKNELAGLVLPLNINSRLSQYERAFQESADHYQRTAKDHGDISSKGMNALHQVRIKAKGLRYIYQYVNKLEDGSYKERADYYKLFQKQFGEINDRKTWLEEIEKHQKKLKSSKKDIKRVKEQLNEELAELVGKINFNAG